MHSYALTAVLISSSLVSAVLGSNIVIPRALQVRQGGDAFIPGTRQGSGTTCVDSFGPNSKLCADSGVCYDSSIGDSCCSEGCKSPSIFLLYLNVTHNKRHRLIHSCHRSMRLRFILPYQRVLLS